MSSTKNSSVAVGDGGDRAAKRRRLLDENDGERTEPVVHRSADLWLNDGNIIKTCSKAAPAVHTMFKVHKSVLVLHCAAFSALFDAGPQAALDAASEHYDGLPVMALTDEPDDVRDNLKALYYPQDTLRHLSPLMPYYTRGWRGVAAQHAGVIRLAAK
ncbi:hypothetical protein BV25DRAFT_1995960 [Artomyces pyxidatus]|uniref:Uncharacterized protein n=1 Tax=Artomyces pyxidatus TaxID=48021 RepID=A0ACB8SHN4_9AGAM|nr:hypothetical protein BV25DRAFT_1995960 [Artomyces pyxidatus]